MKFKFNIFIIKHIHHHWSKKEKKKSFSHVISSCKSELEQTTSRHHLRDETKIGTREIKARTRFRDVIFTHIVGDIADII